jgi:hypothetical protein
MMMPPAFLLLFPSLFTLFVRFREQFGLEEETEEGEDEQED